MKRAMVIVLTMLNALLFIGTIVCAAWTYRNNKIINSANSIFAYREERGEVLFVLKDADEVRLRFDENSVKIVQSYAHDGAENIFRMVLFVREYAREKGYEIERAVTEMYGEIRLHNILYRLRYKREQTGDCDLDYIADRRWYVNVFSKIIGWTGL